MATKQKLSLIPRDCPVYVDVKSLLVQELTMNLVRVK